MVRVAYITWDGPSTQYTEGLFAPTLARLDARSCIVQLTYADKTRIETVRRQVTSLGVGFEAVGIEAPRGGSSKFLFGLARARDELGAALAAFDADVVILRSSLPWLVLGSMRLSVPLIFDSDGLLADERLEQSMKPLRWVEYGGLRALEWSVARSSRVVLARTEAGAATLASRLGPSRAPDVLVVPNGRDATSFYPIGSQEECKETRLRLNLPTSAPLLTYIGSFGPQYLPDQTRALALHLARSLGAHLLVLSGDRDTAAKVFGCVKDRTVRTVAPADVGDYLRSSDLGLALRRPSFSQKAVAPLKVGEFMLSGVPILTTRGIGDMDHILNAGLVAYFYDEGDVPEAAEEWCRAVLRQDRTTIRARCREIGEAHFSLDAAALGYQKAIRLALGQ